MEERESVWTLGVRGILYKAFTVGFGGLTNSLYTWRKMASTKVLWRRDTGVTEIVKSGSIVIVDGPANDRYDA